MGLVVAISLASGTCSPRDHEINHSCVVLDPEVLPVEVPKGEKEAVPDTAGSAFSSSMF